MKKKEAKRRRFTDEQRAAAIALIDRGDVTAEQVAHDLGVTSRAVRRWRQKLEDEGAATPLTRSERAELKQLRKDVARQGRSLDLLKKWSAFVVEDGS